MKKRMVRVLTSAALTAAMVMSMGGMTAFAMDPIDIQKVVTADGNTYAPNTSFSFEVVNVKTGGSFGTGDQKVDYYGSVDDGLTISRDKIASYSPIDDGIIGDAGSEKTVKGAIEVNDSVFVDQPTGVYKYVVKEVVPVDGEKYEGITYDDTVYNVYLYVTEKADGTGKEVSSVVVTQGDNDDKIINNGGDKTDKIRFTNDYGKNNNETHDLTITKKVEGTLGEHNRAFDIDVMIEGAAGEKYKVVKVDKVGNEDDETFDDLVSGEESKKTYSIKDGESIRIYGLSKTDQYTVVENAKYEGEGYTVKYSDGGGEGTVNEDDTKLFITNTKNAVTPTGIVMTFGPYVALIGLAGVFAVTFLRKRREDF